MIQLIIVIAALSLFVPIYLIRTIGRRQGYGHERFKIRKQKKTKTRMMNKDVG